MNKIIFSIFCLNFFVLSRGYKILHIPVPARSHVYSQYFIGRELAKRGHEVHILVHWSVPCNPIWLEEAKEKGLKLMLHKYGHNSILKYDADLELNTITMDIMHHGYGPEYLLEMMTKINHYQQRDLLENSEEIIEHLESIKFDVAVTDYIYIFRHQVFLTQRLKVPMITYSDIVEPWVVRMPWLPSIYSPLMGVENINNTFYDRATNLLLEVISSLNPPFKDPNSEVLAKFCKHCEIKDSKALLSESILFLIPEDPVLDHVRPCPSNVILIGGLTTEPLRDSHSLPIPQHYLDFIESEDNSKTIVVSFGTMVSNFPEHLAKTFIEAFGRLSRYKFIWRYTNNNNLTIPPNLKIEDWLPQRKLLGHKSVKLFITHSGNNGQFEALYHGVPMLAVFVFADQPRNARRIAERGYGEEMDLRTMKTEKLITNIKKIVEDPSYKERIMKASEIFKSRPESPAERAAFWIEHVIKFGGDHLKPAGNDLYFWQYLCLDVLLFFEFVIFAICALLIFVLYKLCSLLQSNVSIFHKLFSHEPTKKTN